MAAPPATDLATKPKRRRSPPKRRSTATGRAAAKKTIKTLPAVWVASPLPVVIDAAPAPETTAEDAVFHAPAVIAAPNRRSAVIRVRDAIARYSFLVASAARRAATEAVHWCDPGIRAAVQRAPRLDARAAAATISAYGRKLSGMLTEWTFVATRAMAVVLIGLTFYALAILAQAPPGSEVDRETSSTIADVAPPTPRAIMPIAAPARSTLADGKRAGAHTSTDVQMIDAPRSKGSCDDQTWPYIAQRCLAVRQN